MMQNESKPKSLVKRLRGLVYNTLRVISPALLNVVAKRVSHTCSENWRYRAKLVRSCPDYKQIVPVANAGRIVDGCQIMHNGLKVLVGSYYGEEATVLFSRTKGVHEPQEEKAFEHILKLIKPGSVMIELGAYWAFYSMWFRQKVPNGSCFLVEPIPSNIDYGKKNFALNGFKGDFTQAYVGRTVGVFDDGTPIICIDNFVSQKGIQQIAILHSDIQGFELDMLQGAETVIRAGRVDYFFISTHGDQMHADCEAFLRERGMNVIVSICTSESYSVDGILVCANPNAPQPAAIDISRRPRED